MSFADLHENDYLIFLMKQSLVCSSLEKWTLLRKRELNEFFEGLLLNSELITLGIYKNQTCYVSIISIDASVEDDLLINFRNLMGVVDDSERSLISRAMQINTWKNQHQFCGQCGQKNYVSDNELAMICDECNIHSYPRISPCIMCLVTKGDECLLANHVRYEQPIYSALAGFVEAGESLEETLHREVAEEVGLKVTGLRYFASQSWPFPHQLMVSYFAEYDSGKIVLQEDEIADAKWFRYDQLPQIPPTSTLSGKLIEAFVKERQQVNNIS